VAGSRKKAAPKLKTREERLDDVLRDLERFRAEWEQLGSPLFTRGGNLSLKQHPLIQMIRSAEQAAERLARPIEASRGGRPPNTIGTHSAPDRQGSLAPPKRTKLRTIDGGGS
jgi:hypothetical protein